jgi:hypothetical protein
MAAHPLPPTTQALVDESHRLLAAGAARLERVRPLVEEARRELEGVLAADRRLVFLAPAERCRVLLNLDAWASRVHAFRERAAADTPLRRIACRYLQALHELDDRQADEVVAFYVERVEPC